MSKFHRVGTQMKKKDKTGSFICLGNPNGKKYAYAVDIRLRDASGNVVFQGENVILNLFDPRKNPNVKDKSKIPENIEFEVIVIEQEDK